MQKLVTGLILLAVMLLATTAHLATPDQDGQPARKATTPMMQEIHDSLARSNAEVLALQQQIAGAPDEEQILGILRAITLKKQDAEISVLRIQQRYARQNGRQDAAAAIEQAISKILHPDPIKPNAEALKAREELRTGGRDHE